MAEVVQTKPFMRTLTVLGSTGSIGISTLSVIRRHKERYRVFALVAGHNAELLLNQIIEFRPRVAILATEEGRSQLLAGLEESRLDRRDWPEVFSAPQARIQAACATEVDIVVSAIVGVEGLEATYAAVKAGKRVGLANKEVLVAGGPLVMDAVRQCRAELIPIDSEHNGAHQCLRAGQSSEVMRLILTASGGPFRNTPVEDLAQVTPEQALNHPTWKMGNRITIDSATMMNKGFEVIEACWLFDLKPSEIEVVIHPQSSIHAMVEYKDGSVVAQASTTDMRMPIQYALTYPDREQAPVPRMDWASERVWEFYPPDLAKFPLLGLSRQAMESGGSATCTLNAADEVAVEAFLQRSIRFPEIAEVVAETLATISSPPARSIGDILEIDRQSRRLAQRFVSRRATVCAGRAGS